MNRRSAIDYSRRSATSGSTFAARPAGRNAANVITSTNVAPTAGNATGSNWATSTSMPCTSRVAFGREWRPWPLSPCHQETGEGPHLAALFRVHRPLPRSHTGVEGKRRVEVVITGRKDDWYRWAAPLAVAGQRKAATEHVHPMDDV